MKPVRDWLQNKNGKIAYSSTQKFRNEWKGKERRLEEWSRAGKLKRANRQKVEDEIDKLMSRRILESNDEHIIALAIVAKVKVLISHDRKLHTDFKNTKLVGGSVYQEPSHKHLLRPDMCP